jgi:hypothetical protein
MPHRWNPLRWLLLACLLALALTGCALPVLGRSSPVLRVARISPRLPPLNVTVTDPAPVQLLFDTAHKLREVPPNAVFFCPVDFGTSYHLNVSSILLAN